MDFWKIKQQANPDVLEIYIYGPIEKYEYDPETWDIKKCEASQNYFRKVLEEHPDVKEIKLYVNSQGGSVLEAMGMRAQLKRHPARVTAYVDGWAASAASFVLTAADKVIMDKSALQMIHNMWIVAAGNAKELRKIADDLDKMMEGNRKAYLEKAGEKLTEEKLIEYMDEETWLTAEECLQIGLCDEILEMKQNQPEQMKATGMLAGTIKADQIQLFPEVPPDNKIEPPEESGTQEEPKNNGSSFMAAMLKAVERITND